jgi:hypothetical protein
MFIGSITYLIINPHQPSWDQTGRAVKAPRAVYYLKPPSSSPVFPVVRSPKRMIENLNLQIEGCESPIDNHPSPIVNRKSPIPQ